MKRLFILLSSLALVTACATWKNLPDRLDDFVDEAELASAKYSAEDWQASRDAYEELIAEYAEHEDQYTQEQKNRVMRDMGRYHALLVVNGIHETTSFIKNLKSILPSYLEGVSDVVKENKEGVRDMFRDIFDVSGIKESIEGLMDDIDDLIEDAGEELDQLEEADGE